MNKLKFSIPKNPSNPLVRWMNSPDTQTNQINENYPLKENQLNNKKDYEQLGGKSLQLQMNNKNNKKKLSKIPNKDRTSKMNLADLRKFDTEERKDYCT